MLEKRIMAKAEKNWKLADEIRKILQDLGITIEDHTDGTSSWRQG